MGVTALTSCCSNDYVGETRLPVGGVGWGGMGESFHYTTLCNRTLCVCVCGGGGGTKVFHIATNTHLYMDVSLFANLKDNYVTNIYTIIQILCHLISTLE